MSALAFLPGVSCDGSHRISGRGRAVCGTHLGRRTLAVDYGLRRIGLAFGVGFAPRPLQRVENRGALGGVAERVAEIARGEMAEQVVVGLPLNGSGEEGEQAKATRKFCGYLRIALPEPSIYLWDERFSTQEARGRLAESGKSSEIIAQRIDSESAATILADFFEQDGSKAELLYKGNGSFAFGAPIETASDPSRIRSFSEWKKELISKSEEKETDASEASRKKKKKRRKKR